MSILQPADRDEPQHMSARDAPARIAKDDAFHILQTPRRRAILRYLLAHDDDCVRIREVAEAVAAWEHDTTVRQLSSDQRQRVYIALYQSHLPKLDDHGVITYNQSRGIVRRRPLLTEFEPYLADGLHGDDGRLATDQSNASSTSGILTSVGKLLTR